MVRPKKDQEKKGKKQPSENAPSYMQPQKPVLEEPLDAEGKALEGVEEVEEVDDVESVDEVEEAELVEPEESSVVEPPYSPYFPRGVYEDAQAVEAYYGRGEEKEGE